MYQCSFLTAKSPRFTPKGRTINKFAVLRSWYSSFANHFGLFVPRIDTKYYMNSFKITISPLSHLFSFFTSSIHHVWRYENHQEKRRQDETNVSDRPLCLCSSTLASLLGLLHFVHCLSSNYTAQKASQRCQMEVSRQHAQKEQKEAFISKAQQKEITNPQAKSHHSIHKA